MFDSVFYVFSGTISRAGSARASHGSLQEKMSLWYPHLMMKSSFLGGLILLLLTACGPLTAQNPSAATTLWPSETAKETPAMNEVSLPTPLDPSLEKIVAQAKNDLAQRLAIDPAQIDLVEAASVTWPDGSLGCPQPGMAYTQVQVDGLLIRLRAGDRIYEYHGGGARAPFLCE